MGAAAAVPTVIGAAGSLLGGNKAQEGANRAADAAGGAAMSQQEEARRQYGELKGITDKATVAGLATYDKALKSQESNLARQEKLISQIDPTVIEASQQALKLLRGEQSSTLGPLKQQRDLSRQKLVNTLREQLGPGAETSSAGMQALSKFDTETSNIFSNAQQSAIQNLGNTFGQFNSGRPDMLREAQGLGGLGRDRASLQFEQAKLQQGFGQPLINSAGAQYVGEQMRGQNQQAMGNSMMGAGMSMFGQGIGSSGGGPSFSSLFSGMGGGSAPSGGAGGFALAGGKGKMGMS